MSRPAALAAVLLVLCPPAALAHTGRAEPGSWWRAWNWDPPVLLSLGLLAWFYGRGLASLWANTRTGYKVSRWQAASFLAALEVIFVALISPVDALSEELSSLHVVQHVLLMSVAAPLFVLGSPALVLAWGLPGGRTGRVQSALSFALRVLQRPALWQPLFLWTLFAVTTWAWHHPVAYQAALRIPLVHDAEHLSFFVVACLFWRACLDPLGRRRLGPAAAVPYLFATSLHASLLGVFLALSPRVWYADYVGRTEVWGLTPLQDQQLAGLIMWMPACLIYPAVAAVLFGTWLARRGGPARNGIPDVRCQAAGG